MNVIWFSRKRLFDWTWRTNIVTALWQSNDCTEGQGNTMGYIMLCYDALAISACFASLFAPLVQASSQVDCSSIDSNHGRHWQPVQPDTLLIRRLPFSGGPSGLAVVERTCK